MKVMLLVHHDEGAFMQFSEAMRQEMLAESVQLTHQLHADKQYLSASPLHPSASSVIVRVRDGNPFVTDGPFIETREQLAGYFLITARDLDEAVRIAARVPGARIGTVEVRPVKEVEDCRMNSRMSNVARPIPLAPWGWLSICCPLLRLRTRNRRSRRGRNRETPSGTSKAMRDSGMTLKVTTPTDREIVLTRTFDAPRNLVFEALTKPVLLGHWFGVFGGWSLAVCKIDLKVGGAYRFVWRGLDGRQMGMSGVYREVEPPQRYVGTESFDDPRYPGEALGTTVLVEQGGRTTVSHTIRYESKAIRDAVLRTRMEHGVAASYDRLADLLARHSGREAREPGGDEG